MADKRYKDKVDRLSKTGIFEFDATLTDQPFEEFVLSLNPKSVRELKLKSESALDLSFISNCSALTSLTLIGENFENLNVSNLKKLKFLNIHGKLAAKTFWSRKGVFDEGIIVHRPSPEVIDLLSGLTRCLLVSCPPPAWPDFQNGGNLRRLYITNVDKNDTNLENLARLSELREIGFHNIRGEITRFDALTQLQQLKSIRIGECSKGKLNTDWLFQLRNVEAKIYCRTTAISWPVIEKLIDLKLLA